MKRILVFLLVLLSVQGFSQRGMLLNGWRQPVEPPTGRSNLIFEDKFDNTPPYTPKWSISQLCCSYSATSTTSPTRIPGGKSVRFEQRKSDWPDHAYVRAELQHPLSEGAVDRKYGFSFYFPSVGFEPDDIQIILQWHHESASGSPPLSINTDGNNYYVVWSDNQVDEHYDVIPGVTIQYDTWVDITMHVKWAANGTGVTEIYFNGQLKYTRNGANMFAGINNYMKIGHYKFVYKNNTSTTVRRIMWVDEVRIGNENSTLIDVTPGPY